jgi:hypothetical protein
MVLGLLTGFDDILSQPFMADRAVVSLDEGVLLGLARLGTCWLMMLRFSSHISSLPTMYSGLLFTRMALGLPRHAMMRSRERPTFSVSVIWSMLPERSKDEDYCKRALGRVAEGLQAA